MSMSSVASRTCFSPVNPKGRGLVSMNTLNAFTPITFIPADKLEMDVFKKVSNYSPSLLKLSFKIVIMTIVGFDTS